jgi:hypothetical protein
MDENGLTETSYGLHGKPCMNHNHNHNDSSHASSFTKTSQLKASSPRLARQIANADQKPQSTRYSEMLPANIITKGQTRPAI